MEEKIIKSILDKINSKTYSDEDHLSFSDRDYKPLKLDKSNFHKIIRSDSKKKIAFVDGGNAEIIRLPELSFQLVRVYYNIFDKNKKIESKRHDFYVLVNAINNGNRIIYNVETIPELREKSLVFDSLDETIREGKHRIEISKIGEVVRRFLELNTARELVNQLNEGDIIVMDGSLKASVTNEADFFNGLYAEALAKKVVISGLSKTCTLLTNKGNSIISVLRSFAPEGSWYYHPIVEINSQEHQAEMFFVKLNEKSKHIFRLEVFNKSKFDIDELLSLLKDNSKDPIFLGYPYGLIDADKFARVSNNEKGYLKTLMMVKLRREDLGENAIDAHSILDKIS